MRFWAPYRSSEIAGRPILGIEVIYSAQFGSPLIHVASAANREEAAGRIRGSRTSTEWGFVTIANGGFGYCAAMFISVSLARHVSA